MVAGLPKKILQRYFYHFRVPLRYKDIERLLDTISKPEYDIAAFPKRWRPEAMVRIKRALEDCRKNEGLVSSAGAEAESNLLEAAAEMGDATAISLLCGARMRQPDVSAEDLDSGSKLLKELMDARFPLAFKVSGDLAFLLSRPNEALRFYELALEAGLDDEKLRVECYRNIGHIAFAGSQLAKAREYFSKACQESDDAKQVSDCHFILAQLREADRIAMRGHLEAAATYGFRDAFLPLANLLLNWFGEARLAREWFELATATDSTGEALVGLLDSAVRLEDQVLAVAVLNKIRAHANGAELLSKRQHIVTKIEPHSPKSIPISRASEPSFHSHQPVKQGRWDF